MPPDKTAVIEKLRRQIAEKEASIRDALAREAELRQRLVDLRQEIKADTVSLESLRD